MGDRVYYTFFTKDALKLADGKTYRYYLPDDFLASKNPKQINVHEIYFYKKIEDSESEEVMYEPIDGLGCYANFATKSVQAKYDGEQESYSANFINVTNTNGTCLKPRKFPYTWNRRNADIYFMDQLGQVVENNYNVVEDKPKYLFVIITELIY